MKPNIAIQSGFCVSGSRSNISLVSVATFQVSIQGEGRPRIHPSALSCVVLAMKSTPGHKHLFVVPAEIDLCQHGILQYSTRPVSFGLGCKRGVCLCTVVSLEFSCFKCASAAAPSLRWSLPSDSMLSASRHFI